MPPSSLSIVKQAQGWHLKAPKSWKKMLRSNYKSFKKSFSLVNYKIVVIDIFIYNMFIFSCDLKFNLQSIINYFSYPVLRITIKTKTLGDINKEMKLNPLKNLITYLQLNRNDKPLQSWLQLVFTQQVFLETAFYFLHSFLFPFRVCYELFLYR